MHQQRPARTGPADFGDASQRARPARRRLTFEGLEPRQMLSLSPALLADIGGPGSSNPSAAVEVNGIGYFSADDGVHGRELWRTDGTAEGTYMLADISPGPTGGMSVHLANLNGTLFFSANDGETGFELWKSDGTTQGTVLVADSTPGPLGTSPTKLTAVGDLIFFSSRLLWRSDGTAAGTFAISTAGTSPNDLADVNGVLFFSADNNGRDLWKSDGTVVGTARVGYANGATNQQPRSMLNVAGTLYFTAGTSRTLWSSDGTAAGTKSFFGFASELTNFNGTLYFSQGAKLYRRSGGSQPTLITDIAPGETTASISGFKAVGDKLFFAGSTNAQGQELWVTDGTNAGTLLVDDLVPGKSGIQPRDLVNVNGTLYFQTRRAEFGGSEVWKSDGTSAGTMRVKDIRPGPDGAEVTNLRNVGGALYFSAEDSEGGRELWISDGSDAGTQRILDVNQQYLRSSGPAFFTAVGAITFLFADSLANGEELWKTDGTEAGTVLVKDIKPGAAGSYPRYLTNINGMLFFVADGENGSRLWRSDGTAEGTFAVTTSSVGLNVTLINANGTLYFTSFSQDVGFQLWESDGTSEGTHPVAGAMPLAPGYSFDNRIWGHVTAVGNDVYYIGIRTDESYWYIYELWRYQPSNGAHTKLAALNEIPSAQQIFSLHAVNDLLYFHTLSDDLWRTDGTLAGTQFLASADVSRDTEWTAIDGHLYFGGRDPAFGVELWTSDGTPEGTLQVADLMPGNSSFDPTNLTTVGDRLFFSSDEYDGGGYLWFSDGTALGTHRIENTHGLAPEAITEFDGRVYFRARGSSDELWTSDGSEVGTFLVAPIEISEGPAFVRHIANANGLLYFAGDDGVHGSEPWILAPPVVARLFYNNSKFDQVAGASGDADDAALAVDKLPYIPGNGRTTGENVSSYSKGINGLFIDLASGHGEITADDFVFRMGTSTDPAGWSDAPAPISITVRAGAGIAGHDRVEIVFADDAIKNTWLEVTVRGNDARGGFHANTALNASSVFYFGSRVGDTFTGNSAAAAVTSAADALQIRAAGGTFAASGNRYDINRDGIVSAGDALLARFNSGILLMLDLPQLTDPPASPTMIAATQMADPLSSAVASALAETLARHVDASAAASSHASGLIDRVPTTGPPRANATAREAAAHFADEALLELTEGESLDETAAEDDDRLLDALLSLS